MSQTDDRVEGIQQLWTEGDYPAVGAGFAPAAEHLAATLPLRDRKVLDAATGTGNFAIAAAKAGADVDAFDLTPALLAVARERAANADVTVRFVAGDLLDAPYPDATFELVVSTFGAFLADDPARCLTELLRVTQPGGQVITTAWAESSAFLAMRRHMHDVAPDVVTDAGAGPFAAPESLSALVKEAAGSGVEVAMTEAEMWIPFASPQSAVDFYANASGPMRRFKAAVSDEQWDQLSQRCATAWDESGRRSPDGIEISANYTIATLTKSP